MVLIGIDNSITKIVIIEQPTVPTNLRIMI